MESTRTDIDSGSTLAGSRRLARLYGTDRRVRIACDDSPTGLDDGSTPTALLADPVDVAARTDPVDPRIGLVLRYDDPAFHDRGDGRRQRTLRGWSVRDLVRLGADAVWLTVWWHPDLGRPVRHGQEKFVEIVGHDAAQHQLPLVLEPVVDARAPAIDGTADRELAIARHAVGRFADERFGAALIAVRCPSGRVMADATVDGLRRHVAQIGHLVDVPWILSTEDDPRGRFAEILDLAVPCGAVGTASTG